MHEKKHRIPTHVLYKIFIYVALIALAISIIVPVAWVFMASLKKNAEFIGADVNPWALPKQFYYQNFVVAFQDARMGDFFLNSFHCDSAGSCTSSDPGSSGILCAGTL